MTPCLQFALSIFLGKEELIYTGMEEIHYLSVITSL